jgi:hypothetical protein
MKHLAQVNIARMLAPIDSPVMKDFVDNLDRINALAESSKGFVWRLKTDDNNATSLRIMDDDFLIVNLSVWQDLSSLFDFVYRTAHVEIYKRRGEWFEKMKESHTALWYVSENAYPTVKDAEEKILHLRKYGESDEVFSIKAAAAKLQKEVRK